MTIDVKAFSGKLLKLTKNLGPQSTYPVPVGRLQALCNHILGEEPEAKRPPLTDVEQSVLSAIKQDFMQGINPTIRSVAKRLNYEHHSSAQGAIKNLIKHGYLKREGSRKQIVVVSNRK